MGKIITYFREARAELARVSWPSRDEIIQSTEAVLLFTLFSMTIFWIYDMAFGAVMQRILQ
ncbi:MULTISPECIES: preprotein translocase subunit SecE [Oceanithermus]|uniref:Protein translocase subunit SecE n=3 Tax=Oceanithermus TaxID=208447 RepID=E4U7Y7_OCEP5|nr:MULTISPECIES: preprotein translocase subunit SecE [Oceanithermus]ADR36077.1 protein translocase subunit secE/sec61 gamma [Oceanithermus profundus DSM 14977]MBB6030702.1 preprotein translocase subunit SecE [Oceanithermus desulfurans]GEM89419.1 protein translocase subunit SecE [Oceanithermus desulfurans NBRC 100063]